MPSADRAAQLALRKVTIGELLRLWPAFDPNDLWPSWSRIEPLVVALVQQRGRDSAGIAAAFYDRMRPDGLTPYTATTAPTEPVEAIVASLRYTGPVQAQKLLRANVKPPKVAETTFVNTAGNVTRLVLNAGRDTTLLNIAADPDAVGYRRIASGNACEFCRMLASRGAVYKADTADFRAHSHCGCTPQPEFAA